MPVTPYMIGKLLHSKKSHSRRLLPVLLILACLAEPTFAEISDAKVEELNQLFEQRRDRAIAQFARKPFKPEPIRDPLGPGRPKYSRYYAFSVCDYVSASLWSQNNLAEANAALIELTDFYISDDAARDDRDNFYWSGELFTRFLELYGTAGSRTPGLLTSEAEGRLEQTLWLWVKKHSKLTETDFSRSQTWWMLDYGDSENHHLQKVITAWHACKLLAEDREYRDQPLDDGHSLAKHHKQWTEYLKYFILERAKKGLFIEVASETYLILSLKGVYNLFDFADDPVLKNRAGQLLDVAWATWAEEQIDGVRGGAKSRVYVGPASTRAQWDRFYRMSYFYFGFGPVQVPQSLILSALTSDYRLPAVVVDLTLDPSGRGDYAIHQFPPGAAEPGFYHPGKGYKLRTDAGMIHRYTWCTPEFILGSFMYPAKDTSYWVNISDQNRWQGVIFAGHPDARIVIQNKDSERSASYNGFWTVQAGGALVSAYLPGNQYAQYLRAWFPSEAGLSEPFTHQEWVCVEAEHAFAAVRVPVGGFRWETDDRDPKGKWLACEELDSAIVLQVATKRQCPDRASFLSRLNDTELTQEGSLLVYRSIAGESLAIDLHRQHPPRINGQAVHFTSDWVLKSPFIQAKRDEGVITVEKDDRKIVLDFNTATNR